MLVIHQLRIAHNFVDLAFAHALSHSHHCMLEVFHRDLAVVVRVEDPESFDQVL